MPGRGFFSSHAFAGSACAAWLLAIAGGFTILHRYEATPGPASAPSVSWPTDTQIPLESNRLTMVLALHPHCPCSTATIGELDKVLSLRPGRARLNVLLYKPAYQSEGWTSSATGQALALWSDTRIWIDEGGKEAARFDALTSGQLLIYDVGGRLRFTGGITSGRGQVGASAGSDAVAAVLEDVLEELKQTPVYGCSLFAAPPRAPGRN